MSEKEPEIEESYQAGPIGANMDHEDDPRISPVVIDLGAHRAGRLDTLNEGGPLAALGAQIKWTLEAMFGGYSLPLTVRGTKSEIDSFTRTLSREKRYLQDFSRFGLDNPRTYRSKSMLDRAVSQFERSTGIKWPFKG